MHNITLRTCFTKTTILFYTFSLHFQLVFQITLASFYSYRATLSMVPCYSTMIGHSVLQFYKSLSCLYFHIVLQWLAIVLYSEIYFPAVLQRYSPLCLYIHAVLQSLAILFYNFTDLYHAYTSTLFSNDLKFCFIHNSHLFWMSTVLWNDWFYSTVIYILLPFQCNDAEIVLSYMDNHYTFILHSYLILPCHSCSVAQLNCLVLSSSSTCLFSCSHLVCADRTILLYSYTFIQPFVMHWQPFLLTVITVYHSIYIFIKSSYTVLAKTFCFTFIIVILSTLPYSHLVMQWPQPFYFTVMLSIILTIFSYNHLLLCQKSHSIFFS